MTWLEKEQWTCHWRHTGSKQHTEICSTSYVTEKPQIQTMTSFIRVTKTSKLAPDANKCWPRYGAAGTPIHSWACRMVQPLWKNPQHPTKQGVLFSEDPAIAPRFFVWVTKSQTNICSSYTHDCHKSEEKVAFSGWVNSGIELTTKEEGACF